MRAVVLGSLLVCNALAAPSTSSIPWWNIVLAQEQGPNACVVEEISGTKHRIWTECKYWNSREVCSTKPLLRYECCEGFTRVPGAQGCTGVKPIRNLIETAKQLGAEKFVNYLDKVGLTQELSTEGPFTLFAPSDEVVQELTRDYKIRPDTMATDQLKLVLQYHIAEGRLTSSHFKADLLVPTRYTGYKLRINKYSSRIETVNCALLQRKDQVATNGVVHIINRFLDPSFTVRRDLAELIAQDGRFQTLSQALDKSGHITTLKSADKHFTVLAPSDEAFSKFSPSRWAKILNDKRALKELLENHILPHVICSAALIGEHKVQTYGTNKVWFDCDKNGAKAENNYLHKDLIVGSNGVIHLIDNLLVPDRAKSIIQIIEEENLLSFLQLVRFAGLEDAFENFGEYTVYIPSEAAMFSLPPTTLRLLKSNKEKARRFVLFHATQGRWTTDKLNNNQIVMSLDEQNPLRIQLYRSGATTNVEPRVVTAVEGATLQKADRECINGVVHIINKALFMANTTAGELLRQNGTYKTFLNAMEKVTSENPSFLEGKKSHTFFVPTDEAFRQLGETRLQQMLSDSVYLSQVLRNHIVENMMFIESFQPNLQYDVPSFIGSLVVTKENGNLKVNDAKTLETDLLTSNGVIHIINKVLLPN